MGLIGRNGAGKTTTIKSILRLVRPDGRTVQFLGKTFGSGRVCTSPGSGLCFRRPLLLPEKKALSQLTAVTKAFIPRGTTKIKSAAAQVLTRRNQARLRALSGHELGKYQLACALSHGAKLLILDEPTSGLDPVSRDDLLICCARSVSRAACPSCFDAHHNGS